MSGKRTVPVEALKACSRKAAGNAGKIQNVTANHEKYRKTEGRILTVFAVVGVVAGGLLDIYYLEMNGRFGSVFGGLAGFVVGFIYLFMRNMKVMRFPKR